MEVRLPIGVSLNSIHCRMVKPRIVLLIFVSGKVVLTGAKVKISFGKEFVATTFLFYSFISHIQLIALLCRCEQKSTRRSRISTQFWRISRSSKTFFSHTKVNHRCIVVLGINLVSAFWPSLGTVWCIDRKRSNFFWNMLTTLVPPYLTKNLKAQ